MPTFAVMFYYFGSPYQYHIIDAFGNVSGDDGYKDKTFLLIEKGKSEELSRFTFKTSYGSVISPTNDDEFNKLVELADELKDKYEVALYFHGLNSNGYDIVVYYDGVEVASYRSKS